MRLASGIGNLPGTYTLLCCLMLVALSYGQESERPNIVLILADDLGYGELGCYGQEIIETPNIDRLASQGIRFLEHYSGAPVCAPARCILLTGKHAGHAYIRGNDEWKERGDVWNFEAATNDPGLEGQRPLAGSEMTIAEMLKEVGYSTGFVGKWGLGAPGSEGVPNKQGFDYFFGYNCQRQAHTLYPAHLWENESKFPLANEILVPHQGLPEGADTLDPADYAMFTQRDYAPEVMHEKALEYIERVADEPFFMVYASPLPHLPLQAPTKWVEYYQQKIPDDTPYPGGNGYFPCYAPRATYAAMISTLDEQVGELTAKLDELGVADNTLVLFTSDNGPTYTGGADTEFFHSAGKYFRTDYGYGKGFLYEGGIRVPLIAKWPGVTPENHTTNHTAVFYDYMATIAEVAQLANPPDSDGISFLTAMRGAKGQEEHKYIYWEQPEYGGQQAVRMGNWKAVIQGLHEGNEQIELYALGRPQQELKDVSTDYPDIAQEFRRIMTEAHTRSSIERFHLPVDKN